MFVTRTNEKANVSNEIVHKSTPDHQVVHFSASWTA